MQARTWVSRALVVIAAVASLATSRKRWQVDAEWPAGAPQESPDSKHGVMFAVEASRPPDVSCDFGATYIPRMMRLAPEAGTGEYFCPPGGRARAGLDGHVEGGCGKKASGPPEGTFVRVTKAEPVAAWEANGQARFTFRTDANGYGKVGIVVRSPQRARLQAWLDGPDAPLFGGLDAFEGPANHFTIYAYAQRSGEPARDVTVEVVVRAYAFGYCRPACGPAAEPIAVEAE